MTTDFVTLKLEDDVATAIEKVRNQGRMAETVNYCYVVDSKKTLKGYLKLRELLFHKHDDLIEDIMVDRPVSINTKEDQEEAAHLFEKYDMTAIPVVNDENCLVGIITVDDIIDVIHEEATEDIQKMNAITPLEDTYLETSTWDMYKSRIIWLLILMISATFTGSIMQSYEDVLNEYVVLSIFIPMLMDAGGECW